MSLPPILRFDGVRATAAVCGLNVSRPVQPELRGDPLRRDPLTLAAVINQFAVGHNPRYQPRDTSGDGKRDTHCDAFANDVCDALGVQLPRWVGQDGTPMEPGKGRELNANGTATWLATQGVRFGWREVGRVDTQELANLGHPVLGAWLNPMGSGHLVVVRPAEPRAQGPVVAQAGARCFNEGVLADASETLEHAPVRWWVNDKGAGLAGAQWTPPQHLVDEALVDLGRTDPLYLRLADALFTRLTLRQGSRSAISGVKLPPFAGCTPLVRADWADVARFLGRALQQVVGSDKPLGPVVATVVHACEDELQGKRT